MVNIEVPQQICFKKCEEFTLCAHVCTYARMHTCTYARMHTCTYARMYICTYVHMYVQMYISAENQFSIFQSWAWFTGKVRPPFFCQKLFKKNNVFCENVRKIKYELHA
jgi:hypothetical protein